MRKDLGDFIYRIYIGMFPTNKSPKVSYKFVCELCNYKCNKQSEINKHNSTRKHQILHNPTSDTTSDTTSRTYICKCGKVYKHSSTLYAHRNKCEITSSNATSHTTNMNLNETNPVLLEKMFAMFTQMMTQNQDFMTNVIGKVQGNNTNSFNTNNNQFNIQMFLNEVCRRLIETTHEETTNNETAHTETDIPPT